MKIKAEKSATMRNKRLGDYFWGYALIFPTVFGIGVFYLGAFLLNLYYSFTNMGAFGKYKWIGLDNYQKLLQDPDIAQTLMNTFKYVMLSVPLTIFTAIVVASLLNSRIKGIGVYRTLYFLPAVTMPAAVAMVWRLLYNGQYGLVNQVLSVFGIKSIAWVADPKYAMIALVFVAVWMNVGFYMVILLAGLQGIPKSYYEAASIDGAGPVTQFFHITLPLLSPTIFFTLVMSLIEAFQVFDLIYLMISRTSIAIGNTRTIVYLFYNYAFEWNNKGYAAAIAILIFAIIMVVTVFQLYYQKKWVHYE